MATRPPGAGPWTLEHRGPFLVGRCVTCGYAGPARRARYSVETDMAAHEVLCTAARTSVPAALEPSAADLALTDAASADLALTDAVSADLAVDVVVADLAGVASGDQPAAGEGLPGPEGDTEPRGS